MIAVTKVIKALTPFHPGSFRNRTIVFSQPAATLLLSGLLPCRLLVGAKGADAAARLFLPCFFLLLLI